MNLIKPPLFQPIKNLAVKQAQFSYADMLEWEHETLTASFLESKENIVLVQCQEEAVYNIKIRCKAGTKNSFFFHSCIHTQQKISVEFEIEERAELACIFHVHNQQNAELSLLIKTNLQDFSKCTFTHVFMNQGKFSSQFVSENKKHAKSRYSSLVIGKGESFADVICENKNIQNNSESITNMRTILQDSAQCRMQGLPVIETTAPESSAHLEQKTLLLSKKARIQAIPLLAVSNNQVQASHASSVSSFSPEDIFYITSRGIDFSEAKKLIVEGFLAESFQWIESENMQQCLQENIKEFIGE